MLDKAPDGKMSDLLNALDKALSAGEVERAVDLFQTDCYWRDLVTFTWNIKTMEGKEQVRDMLKARLADTKPSNWKIADGEDASEADGIIESWIQFETGGRARLWPHAPEGRPDLDVADDHERTQGTRRASGLRPSDGGETRRRTQSKDVEGRTRGGSCRTRLLASALLRHRWWRSGRHRTRSPAAPAQRADDHHREKRKAWRQLAQALQVTLPA